MGGPRKDLFLIPGQANIHEFCINQLLDKLITWFCFGLGFFLSKCYLRTTALGRLVHIWACQEGACEVPRELCLDFGAAEQGLRGSS